MRSKIRGRRKRHFSIKKLCPLTNIADSKMGFLGLFKNGGVYLFYKLLIHSAAVVRNYDFKMASWIFCGHRSCRNSLWQCRFLPGRFNRFSRQWDSLKKHRNFFCARVIFYILQRFLHNPVNIQKLVGIQARKINIVFRNQTELKRFAENKTFYKRRSGFLPINFYNIFYFLEWVNCRYIGVFVFIVTIHLISLIRITVITVIFSSRKLIACYRNKFRYIKKT